MSSQHTMNPRQALNAQQMSEDQALVMFLYQSSMGLLQSDLEGNITLMNPVAAEMLLPLALHGKITNLFDILRLSAPQLPQLIEEFEGERGIICESLRIASSASTRNGVPPRVLALKLVKLGAGGLMASISDVTRERQREEDGALARSQQAASIDPLTSLPDRAAALARVAALIADIPPGCRSRFAVLFLDCDRFGQINDNHGREIGDALLRSLALRLANTVRGGDVVSPVDASEWSAARLGGDEFLVVLDGIDTAQNAVAITQRLLDGLSRPHMIGGKRLQVTLTAGLVPPGQISGDAESLLHDAYLAMTQGKRTGGARVAAFEPAMRIQAGQRGRLEHELYQAISNRQLFVAYQPLVRLADRRLAGLEALVRWQHPTRGVVLPEEFLEVAEEANLISALDDFVVADACRQWLQWQLLPRGSVPARLSVNLSRAQLMAPDIVGRFEALLGRTGFDPARLTLDVTESLIARHEGIQRRLRALRDLGIRLALDNFGTGYSSLSSLHLLPVDVVKIDRSLVRQLGHSVQHAVLVEAMLSVARSLGMHTVAEGIETGAQLAILTELQCDEGQGHLFSPALDVADATLWLQAQAGPGRGPSGVAAAISLPPLVRLG